MDKDIFLKIQSFLLSLNSPRILVLLGAIGFAVYANAIPHPFVHDDTIFIKNNPYIADLNLKNILKQTSMHDPKFPLVNTYYRPLLEVFNRLLYRIFSFNPYGFHFVNVLLHIINSFLVFLLVKNIFDRKKTVAFIIALLFMIHPVQTEAVACISGSSNLIFSLLCLMSFHFYVLSWKKENRSQKAYFYLLSLVVFFIALLSKEQSVVLPVIIFFFHVCLDEGFRKSWGKVIIKLFGFGVCLGLYLLLRIYLFGHALTPSFSGNAENYLRFLSIPRSLVTHVSLIFFPYGLHYYRNIDMLAPYQWPFIQLFIILAAVAAVIYMIKPGRRVLVFGLLWFTAALLPALNIVPLVNEYSFLLTAEHFLYFPIVGMLIFIVFAADEFIKSRVGSRIKDAVCVLLIGVCMLFSVMTVRQNYYWRDEVTLFERTVMFEKDFGRGRNLLAAAYYFDGQFVKSIVENKRALEIMEGYLKKVTHPKVKSFYLEHIRTINLVLAYTYEALGDFKSGAYHYHETLKIDGKNPVVFANLGMNALKQSNLDDAAVYFKKAVELDSQNLMNYNSLALCYIEKGRYEEAEPLLRFIVEKDPSSQSARGNLKKLLEKMEKK